MTYITLQLYSRAPVNFIRPQVSGTRKKLVQESRQTLKKLAHWF